jgi:hypothetical protein
VLGDNVRKGAAAVDPELPLLGIIHHLMIIRVAAIKMQPVC